MTQFYISMKWHFLKSDVWVGVMADEQQIVMLWGGEDRKSDIAVEAIESSRIIMATGTAAAWSDDRPRFVQISIVIALLGLLDTRWL